MIGEVAPLAGLPLSCPVEFIFIHEWLYNGQGCGVSGYSLMNTGYRVREFKPDRTSVYYRTSFGHNLSLMEMVWVFVCVCQYCDHAIRLWLCQSCCNDRLTLVYIVLGLLLPGLSTLKEKLIIVHSVPLLQTFPLWNCETALYLIFWLLKLNIFSFWCSLNIMFP